MRVLFLQRQPCVRALKLAVGLRGAMPGLRLDFAFQGVTLDELYGSGNHLFDGWHHLPLPDAAAAAALTGLVERLRPDVVHGHNLPDTLTVLAQEVVDGRVPVVHDVHDLQSLRATAYEDGFPEPAGTAALERRAVEDSDALVTVSDELLGEIAARHRPPPVRLVFSNHALRRDMPALLPPPARPLSRPPRLVYQGTLSVNGGHYDLRGILCGLTAGGAEVHVHPARELREYHALAAEHPGIRVHAPLPPADLVGALTGYDAGWAGFNDRLNRAHLDTALPNKLYEYLGAGLPVLTLPHRALARFVEDEGVGLVLGDPAEAARRLAAADLPALRRRVAERRHDHTVEARIGGLADLYRDLSGTR